MPSDRRIRVMISSRCLDPVSLGGKEVPFTDLRRAIKAKVEQYAPFGAPLFECWINEDSPATEGSTDSWDECLRQVRDADILVVLYNGNPGWSVESDGIGICHAELEKGLNTGAAKVFALVLPEVSLPTRAADRKRFERFRQYFANQNQFAPRVKDGDAVLLAAPGTLQQALVELVQLGGRETRKGKYDTGEALDWSRLSFADRKSMIEQVVRSAVAGRDDATDRSGELRVRIAGTEVLLRVHAIPGPFANATAREMIGRPFHSDYEFVRALTPKHGGPLHLIACHRGVTEHQATDLLGQPDAATVDSSYGVLAFDRVTGIQCLFLRNCRDDTSTRMAVQRAFEWLKRSGEDRRVAERALARARITKAIAAENPSDASSRDGR